MLFLSMTSSSQAAASKSDDGDQVPLLDETADEESSQRKVTPIVARDTEERTSTTQAVVSHACGSDSFSSEFCTAARWLDAFNVKKNWHSLFHKDRSSDLAVLDGVRSFSILWIIGLHTWWILGWWYTSDASYRELDGSLLMRAVKNGDLAVDMFFVLSGFLIAFILIREWNKTGAVSVWRFYLRRWLRITPAYAVVLACFWGGQYFIKLCEGDCNYCNLFGWSNLLFINNFVSPAFVSCMIWTWSIAVEMQFYVFSPFIIWLLMRRRNWGLALLAFLFVLTLFLRGLLVFVFDFHLFNEPPPDYSDKIYTKVYTRMGPYLLGMLLGYINCKRESDASNSATNKSPTVAATPAPLVIALRPVVVDTAVSDSGSGSDDGSSTGSSSNSPALGDDINTTSTTYINTPVLLQAVAVPPEPATVSHPWWVQVLWLLSLAGVGLGVSVEIVFAHAYAGEVIPWVRLLYFTFHRTIMGACTCVMIALCLFVHRAHGVVINAVASAVRWVLSWRVWYAMANLTYCLYLVHVIVIFGHAWQRTFPSMDYLRFIELWVENVLLSVIVSIPLHLFVEKPFMNLRI